MKSPGRTRDAISSGTEILGLTRGPQVFRGSLLCEGEGKGASKVHGDSRGLRNTGWTAVAAFHQSMAAITRDEEVSIRSFAPEGGPFIPYEGGRVETECLYQDEGISSGESTKYAIAADCHFTRISQIDGVETAIQQWDQEAVDELVEKLELDVVHVDGETGEKNRPRLRIVRRVNWW